MNDLDLNGGTLNGPEYLVLQVYPSAGVLAFGHPQPEVALYRLPIVDPAPGHLTFGHPQPTVTLYRLPIVNPAAGVLTFGHPQPDVWFNALATSPGLSPGVESDAWIYLVEVGAAIGDAAAMTEAINGFELNGSAVGGVIAATLRYTNSSMGYATDRKSTRLNSSHRL